jgi:hypothetical protein
MPRADLSGSAWPAADSKSGKTHESPAPNTANPAMAMAGLRLTTAAASPDAASTPHSRSSGAGPKRSASRSPDRRPIAIETQKPA